jgi:hypothetical protein
MGVALDLHELGDLDRAELGDTADVVPPEVDQHDVLGALLGIVLQPLLDLAVLGFGSAARVCAGDRSQIDPIASTRTRTWDEPTMDIGPSRKRKRYGDGLIVRAREDRERIGGEAAVQASGEHDLVCVAGHDEPFALCTASRTATRSWSR